MKALTQWIERYYLRKIEEEYQIEVKVQLAISGARSLYNHKHCPVCGRMIDSESEEAYYHIYAPTRCDKVNR